MTEEEIADELTTTYPFDMSRGRIDFNVNDAPLFISRLYSLFTEKV